MTDNGVWSHTYDFTKNDGGFNGNILAGSRGYRAFYSSGVGWIAANNFLGLVQIQSPTFSQTTLMSFTMTISSPLTGPFHQMEIAIPDANGTDYFIDQGSDLVRIMPFPNGVSTTSFFLGADNDTAHPGQAYTGAITKLEVTGIGVNPFLDHYCAACAINYIGIDIEEALETIAVGIGL